MLAAVSHGWPCLKCLDAYSVEQNIARTMDLTRNTDESMDEVLLSSVVEACVRIRTLELLSIKLEPLKTLPAAAA